MKKFRNTIASLTSAVLITGLALNFNACTQNNPVSPKQEVQTDNGLKILKLGGSFSLQKVMQVTEQVTVANGGALLLEHGVPSGNFIYANQNDSPYHVYRVDLSSPANTVIVGQLAFATSGIALHPTNGLLYYVADKKVNGIHQVATWDPATNTNTILPEGSSFNPANKLAFAPDGTLYGIDRHSSGPDELFTINTITGEWTLLREYNVDLSDRGDLAVSPNGTLYNLNDDTQELQVIDLNSNQVSILGNIVLNDMTGLAFGVDGQLYLTRDNQKIYSVNASTAATTYLGRADAVEIDDAAPVIASTELSYARVELEILPGTISADESLSLSIETTELQGGVAVTFGPHGTTFSQPAILNIEAHGVDFSGINAESVNVYYDNQETGQWELMQSDNIIIDVNAGTIQVINALLPHFSRYAIGTE